MPKNEIYTDDFDGAIPQHAPSNPAGNTDPGRTLRYCASTGTLQFRDLREESVGKDGFHTTIQLRTEDGLLAEHHLSWQ